jgi:hypothetical protein
MFPQVLFKMFGRKEKLGMNKYNSFFPQQAVHRQLQFLENALVALPVLRQLEQLRQSSETQLQTSFDNYEKCNAIRMTTSCT